MLFIALLSTLLIKVCVAGKAQLPQNWWLNTNAKSISSMEEFMHEVNDVNPNRHIFVDFYMQYCAWCYYC